MAREIKPIDVNEIHGVPELLRIVEELRETRESPVIERDGEEAAILSPVRPRPKRATQRRKSGIITEDDSLWNIVGMAGDDDGPTDVARNKHKYLAEAYAIKRP